VQRIFAFLDHRWLSRVSNLAWIFGVVAAAVKAATRQLHHSDPLLVVAVVLMAIGLTGHALAYVARRARTRSDYVRQHEIVRRLGQEYTQTHSDVPLQIRLATEPLPKEWVERRLEEMGETWRWDRYLI
jgi:hypothetical protein